jgi:nucleoside-diphosphate-sugar epimerase
MKTALVTGGLGFIGSALARRLADDGWQVTIVDLKDHDGQVRRTGIDYSIPEGTFFKNPNIKEITRSDFASLYAVLKSVYKKEFDVVFHQAAFPSILYCTEHPVTSTENNLYKTIKLLSACTGNVKRFIFASSSSVYGDADIPTKEDYPKNPQSLYAVQKSSVEDFCKVYSNTYGLDTVCLRYFNVFGPGQTTSGPYATAISNWCHAIKNDFPLRSDGDGTQSRDLAYIDNVLDANLLVANSDQKFAGDVFNVASNNSISNNTILDYLKTRYPSITIDHASTRPKDVHKTQADISKISTQLGYAPRFTFEEGLEKTLEWWGL